MKTNPEKCLVLLSGGQDSFTALGWARSQFKEVAAISFDYGQRHRVELAAAEGLCSRYSLTHQIVDIGFFAGLATSALTGAGDVSQPHPYLPNVPASFVPNRNGLLLTLAHTMAQQVGAAYLVGGMCETDFSGYPDCREHFVNEMVRVLNLGSGAEILLATPLMHLDKAQTFELADRVGFLNEVIQSSHTCYEGNHDTLNLWGYGCGECPACKLRSAGYHKYVNGDFGPIPNDLEDLF